MAETVKKLSVKFEGDTTGLNTAVKRATESFKDVDSAVKSLQKQFDDFGSGTSITKQTEALKVYETSITTCKTTLNKLYDIKKQLEDQDKSGQGLYKATKQYQDLETKIAYVTKRQKEFQESYESLSKENQDAVKIATIYEQIAKQIEGSNKKLEETQSFIQVINKALEYSPNSVSLLNLQTEQFEKQLKECNSNTMSLAHYLNSLKNAGVDTLSKDFIEANNALKESKARYQELKAKTLEYYDALSKASKLADDIATRGNVLKKALELEPTNTELITKYQKILSQEIEESVRNEKAFKQAIESLPKNSIKNVSKEYVELASGLANAQKQTSYLRQEQQRATETVAKYNAKMKEIKDTINATSKTASVLKKALELDPTNTQKQQQYTEFLRQAIESCKKQQELLNQEIKELDVSNADVLKGKYTELTENLNNVVSKQREYEDALQETTQAANTNGKAVESNVTVTADFNTVLNTLHSTLSRVASKLGSLSNSLLDNAVSYESSIASIKKVVTDLSDDTVESLKQIAVASGSTFDSIAEYATLGATLGIAQNALADFTDAMVKLEAASDGSIAGEEGAKQVARLLNQFGIGAEYAENFGSAVTYVGDQFAATANEIVEVASRMGGLSAINKVTINDLVGLASEMKNLGIETESGASAITKTFLSINTKVATGAESLSDFASVAGKSAKEFTDAWNKAPMDAFLSFINGLSSEVFNEINEAVDSGSISLNEYASALDTTTDSFKAMWKQDPTGTFEKYKDALGNLEEGSESASVVLSDLKINAVRTAQTLLKLAGNGDVVRDAIKDSSKAWEENTNLTRKANTVYETTEKKLESAKEAIRQAAASLGDTFLPIVKNVADVVTSSTKTFNSLPKSAKTAIASATLLATGIAKVGSSAMGTLSWLNQMSMGSSGLSKACGGLLKTITGGGGLVTALSSALPFALGAAGVGLVAYAGYQLYANTETTKFLNTMDKLSSEASSNFINSLTRINEELAPTQEAFENAAQAADSLEFNKDGKVDTSKESYKNLKEQIDKLNETLGENIYHLDIETGKIVDQNGEVVNLTKQYELLRIEKQRDAWLDAHQEEYNESLKTQNEQMSKIVDLQYQLNDYLDKYKSKGLPYTDEEIEQYFNVAQGLENTSKWSKEAKEKYQAFMEYVTAQNDGVRGLFSNLQVANNLYEKANEVVTTFNDLSTAPIESVQGMLNALAATDYAIKLQYDSTSYDSTCAMLDEIDSKIKIAEERAGQGFDTTNTLEQLYAIREEVQKNKESFTSQIQQNQIDLDGFANSAKTSYGQASTSITDFATKGYSSFEAMTQNWLALSKNTLTGVGGLEEQLASTRANTETIFGEAFEGIKTQAENAMKNDSNSVINTFKTVDDYQFQNKYIDVYVNYHDSGYNGQSSTSGKKTSYSGRSGGFNSGFTSLVPDLTIPRLSSGGHGTMTLKASFTINNNGDNITQSMSQRIGKQIVNYINEELGKGI